MTDLYFRVTRHCVLPVTLLASVLGLVSCASYDAEDPMTASASATAAGTASTTGSSAGSDGMTMAGANTGDTGSGGGSMSSGTRLQAPEASCDDTADCGGAVLGNWFAVDSCLTVGGMADLSMLGIGCAQGTASGTLEVTGNWTFADDPDADGDELLTDTTQTTGELLLGLGPECLDVSGTMVGCGDIAGPLRSAGFESTECVDSSTIEGGCDCTGIVNQAGTAGFVTFDAGPMALWSTQEGSLTAAGFTTVDYDYCIEQDAFLHVSVATTNPNGTVTGTVVFQKQP